MLVQQKKKGVLLKRERERERKERVEDVDSLDRLQTVGLNPFTVSLVATNNTMTMFKRSVENKNHDVFK